MNRKWALNINCFWIRSGNYASYTNAEWECKVINNCMFKNWLFILSTIFFLAITLQSMANFLLPTEVTSLKALHKKADKKQRDKIKAILMLNKGYEYREIAENLLIDNTTGWHWYETYITGGKRSCSRTFILEAHASLPIWPPYSPNLNVIERLWIFFKK